MIELELILKLPNDKLPFIGILFLDSYVASTTNKSYANNYRHDLYTLDITPKTDVRADVKIKSGIGGGTYFDVKYNIMALRRFIQITHYHPYINFGHVYIKDGEHKIAKTTNQDNWVLKLAKINMIELQDKQTLSIA